MLRTYRACGPIKQQHRLSSPYQLASANQNPKVNSNSGAASKAIRAAVAAAAAATPQQQPQQPRSQQQQRRRRRQQQQQQPDADLDVDEIFLDPAESARLRRLVKAKGIEAVVDSEGFVKVPVHDDNTEGEGENEDPQEAAAAAAVDADTSSSSSSSAARQKLFDKSLLQAAVPGSAGKAPVLPIVRPTTSGSSSSSSHGSTRQQQQQPPRSSSSSRGGPPAAAFFSRKGWQDLGATNDVINALKSLGITQPSHIQAEAYKALSPRSGFKHVAVADQAGSGKTLAYLLPLLQQLKQQEVKQGGPCTAPGSPAIIVMAPTAELAQQVGRVVRALSSAGLRVRSAVMTGGQGEADRRSKTFRTQCELLGGGVDVVVATPGRLRAHLDKGSLTLTHTAALVLDEVDVLAGGEVSYSEHIAPLRAAAPTAMRCVLVSATLPQHTFDDLQDLFAGLGAAFGPGLHKTATGLVEELVDCSGGDEISLESGTSRKLEALSAALQRVRSPRTVVFCNKIETCRVVENALKRREQGYKVVAYHEAIREDLRAAALTSWLSPPTPSQQPMVLVCTDRTSRGIDSMWCEHVVLFEFPRDPSEYVRRVGRTARGAGGRGVVTVLVLGKQVALAKDILSRNREGGAGTPRAAPVE